MRAGVITEADHKFLARLVDEAIKAHDGDAAATFATVGGEEQIYASFGGLIELTDTGVVTKVQTTDAFEIAPQYLDAGQVPGVQETPGRYTHGSEYGRGGMGRVLLVHDAFLGRDVALKELLPGPTPKDPNSPSTPFRKYMGFLERFLQEARITGQLEHPSIVPVYELGHRKDGTLYYTMKLVRGKTLRQAIHECKSLRERLELLSPFVNLCQAIAYAHSRRILHRDLKPDNVMVGEFGETVVLDWGLAKAKDGEDVHADGLAETIRLLNLGAVDTAARTQYGQVMGTPAYMPPEQAKGQLEQVDERSDIYSLGAVLYEILSGQAPFTGTHVQEILRKVIQEDPRPVRDHDPEIPAELAAICARSMLKAPGQRYASPRELAEEVQRFQSGALVRSYRYRFRDYLGFYWRRYKPLVATGAAAFVAINIIGALYVHNLYVSVRTERELRSQAEAAQRNEAAARDTAEREGYYSDILLANELLKSSNYIGAQAALWKTPEYLRGWEWGYLLRECNADFATLQGPKGGVLTTSFNPDGTRICLGLVRGGAVILDSRTGETILHVKSDWTETTSACFSPDGSLLLVTGEDHGPFLVDPNTGAVVRALTSIRNSGAINGVFTPDGTRIIQRSNRNQGEVLVTDSQSGAQLSEFDFTGEILNSVGVSLTTNEFVASSDTGLAIVADIDTGNILLKLSHDNEPVKDAKFSPNGERIATATSAGTVRIWERATGARLQVMKLHESSIYSVAFDPSGELIVTAAGDRTAAIAHAASGERLATLRGHSNAILNAQFATLGKQIVTASLDGSVRIWGLERALEKNELSSIGAKLHSATLAPGSRLVLVVNGGNEHFFPFIQIFDAVTSREIATFGGFAEEITMANFNADGTRIVAATANKASYILDSNNGQVLTELLGHRDVVRDAEFSKDGQFVVSASADKTAAVWNVESGEMIQKLKGHEALVRHARFNSGGDKVLTTSDDGTARIWDVETGEQLAFTRPTKSGGVLAAVFDTSEQTC
ncbi:MAG: protein kinase [Candidatus Hydrogenedentes bacterium]|nr:protein kinase [Candidatus Hydrogenedentota bacterium]